MTKNDFKNIFDSGDNEKLYLAVTEMNKRFTIRELSLMACVTYSQFRIRIKKLGLVSNKKIAKKAKQIIFSE